MKPVYWVFLSLLMLCSWIAWEWPAPEPVLVMCDVGQGDAMLVTQGFSQMVVDTGNEPDKLMRCLSQHMPFWDRRVELVVLTHPEIDHIGAFAEIMQAYAVKTLLVSPVSNDTQEFKDIYHTISKSNIRVITASQGQVLQWGAAQLRILWPLPQEESIWRNNYTYTYHNISKTTNEKIKILDVQNPNEFSVVLEIKVDKRHLLLTGDISTEVELALVDQGLIHDIDILKVAHHGSKTSSANLFLDTVKPELVLISVGRRNRYGHPHPDVISRLSERNIPYRRTDVDGMVSIILDQNALISEKYSKLPDWLSLYLKLTLPL